MLNKTAFNLTSLLVLSFLFAFNAVSADLTPLRTKIISATQNFEPVDQFTSIRNIGFNQNGIYFNAALGVYGGSEDLVFYKSYSYQGAYEHYPYLWNTSNPQDSYYIYSIKIVWSNVVSPHGLNIFAREDRYFENEDIFYEEEEGEEYFITSLSRPEDSINGEYISEYVFTDAYKYFGIGMNITNDEDFPEVRIKSIELTWYDVPPADVPSDDDTILIDWTANGFSIDSDNVELTYLVDNSLSLDFTAQDNLSSEMIEELKKNLVFDVSCPLHDSDEVCYTTSEGVISFLRAGNYTISAESRCENFVAKSKDLQVEVKPLKVEITFDENNSLSSPWHNENAIVLKEIASLNIGSENAAKFSVEDLKLSFELTPAFEISSMPTTKPDGVADETWEMMVRHYGVFSSQNINHDGFITDTEARYETQITMVDKNIDLTVILPCSGLYNLIAKSSDESIWIDYAPIKVNVYPTLLTYSGLPLNEGLEPGVLTPTFNTLPVSDGVVEYPMYRTGENGDHTLWGTPQSCRIYLPGYFGGEIYYRLAATPTRSLQDYELYNDENGIDVSTLTDTNPLTLHLVLTKNGASTPTDLSGLNSEEQILIKAVKKDEVATGICVPEIENDLNGIRYYNLHGVEVSETNLLPGLYIVRKGETSKTILIK